VVPGFWSGTIALADVKKIGKDTDNGDVM